MDITWTYDTEYDRHVCILQHCEVTVWQDAIGRWVARIQSGRRTRLWADFDTLDETKVWGVVEAMRINACDRRRHAR